MKPYCIHPGMITCKVCGIKHDMGFDRLIQIYGLERKDCAQYRPKSNIHLGIICLRPKYSGRSGPNSGNG